MKGSSNRSAFAWKALNSSCTKEQGGAEGGWACIHSCRFCTISIPSGCQCGKSAATINNSEVDVVIF